MSHSVLIVEDDPVFRENFVLAVQAAQDLVLVGQADDLPDGLRLLAATKPDVLLVDIGLPSGSGIELIRQANEHHPSCDVMVITLFGDEHHVLECIAAGATGYLLKDTSHIALADQIRALRNGGSPINPVIARQLLKRLKKEEASPTQRISTNVPALSNQEIAVLELSTKGYNYDEVARLLNLSGHTVKTYVKRIYRKLNVSTKSEASYEARKLGLIRG
jgi:DNA-binding NarL/FixJ family response regulator